MIMLELKIYIKILFLYILIYCLFISQALSEDLVSVTGIGVSAPMNINSFVPVIASSSLANRQAMSLLFRPVLWFDADHNLDLSNSIAKKILVSDDDKKYTITLKKFEWSNGRPVTSADVLYDYDLIKLYGNRYPTYQMGGIPNLIKDIKIINNREFSVIISHKMNPVWFEYNGLSQLVPLPRFIFKKYKLSEIVKMQSNMKLLDIVDGPYKLEKFINGREAIFIRNKIYSGVPYSAKKIVIKMYSSPLMAFLALRSGYLDVAGLQPFMNQAYKKLYHFDTCYAEKNFFINYIEINYRNKNNSFLDKQKIREALSYAINQSIIIKVAFHGFGEAQFGPIPSSASSFLSPKMRYIDSHPNKQFDPKKADNILRTNGFIRGRNGYRFKNGKELEFTLTIPSGNITTTSEAELIQFFYKQVGIKMKIKLATFNRVLYLLSSHNQSWNAIMIGWGYNPDFYPSGDGLFNTGGGINDGGYSNNKMNILINKNISRKNIKYLFEYENYAARTLPVIFLPSAGTIVEYKKKSPINDALYLVKCSKKNK